MQYSSRLTVAMLALIGLLGVSACDRRGDEYTSPQDRSSEMGGTTEDSTTAPPANMPTTPPAGGGTGTGAE